MNPRSWSAHLAAYQYRVQADANPKTAEGGRAELGTPQAFGAPLGARGGFPVCSVPPTDRPARAGQNQGRKRPRGEGGGGGRSAGEAEVQFSSNRQKRSSVSMGSVESERKWGYTDRGLNTNETSHK